MYCLNVNCCYLHIVYIWSIPLHSSVSNISNRSLHSDSHVFDLFAYTNYNNILLNIIKKLKGITYHAFYLHIVVILVISWTPRKKKIVILPDAGRRTTFRNVVLITVYEIHLTQCAMSNVTCIIHKSTLVTRFLSVYLLSIKGINISILDLVMAFHHWRTCSIHRCTFFPSPLRLPDLCYIAFRIALIHVPYRPGSKYFRLRKPGSEV